jgi:hypothetical protein
LLADFVLEEVATVKLPVGTTVNGAALLTKNEIVLWNEKGLSRWDAATGSIAKLPCTEANIEVVAVAEMMSPRELLFVARAPRRSLILQAGGSCSSVKAAWTYELERTLADEQMRDRQLVVASARQARVLELRENRPPQLIEIPYSSGMAKTWTIPSQRFRLGPARDYTAIADSTGVWISEVYFPFRTIRIDSTGRVVTLLDPTRGIDASQRAKFLRGWVSSGLRLVPPGYLMMVADPSTDRRTLLILDASGRVIRMKDINVALAFLSIGSREQRLVAIRDVGELEIVLYRWRWRTNPQAKENSIHDKTNTNLSSRGVDTSRLRTRGSSGVLGVH